MTVSVIGSIRPGQTATMTWTVTGTRKPLRLYLYNTNSESGVLEGGNAQTATTSGGKKNAVSRKVTGLAPGSFYVNVQVDLEHEATSPQELAARFRRELHRIAKETDKAARRVPVEDSHVRTADVIALLDRVEDDIRRSLPQPELAAFREAVGMHIDELRREAFEKSITRRERNRVVFLVRQGAPPGGRMPAKEARSLIGRLVDWITDSERASLLRTVCVVTEPAGANVLLYPSSFPAERNETRSIGPLTLYLGIYIYEITLDNRKSTGTVNLLKETGSVLQCLDDASKCTLIPVSRKSCP